MLAARQEEWSSADTGRDLRRFTEGFATKDLQEAKALLDELMEDRSVPAESCAQVIELLQREGRVAYRALERTFALNEEYLEEHL